MGPSIYLIQEGGALVELKAQAYHSEALLQELIARYPNVLAGDEIDADSPRRWLLVAREVSVPAEEGRSGRWSLDHLFLDQDAIPTLVEVKRRSDTRIRREVVGQMLEYAANGIVYWPLDAVRAALAATCQRQGKDPEEVLAVEVRQFVAHGLKTLVPRVLGRTAEAERRKGVSAGEGQLWQRETFLEALRACVPDPEAKAIERVFRIFEETASDMGYGRARTGSVSPKFPAASGRSFFTIRTDGRLQINLGWHDQPDAGPRAAQIRDELVRRLRAGGLVIPDGQYPVLRAAAWTARADVLVESIRDLFGSRT